MMGSIRTASSQNSQTVFHLTAGFWGFYLIVMYCMTMIMLRLQSLLMPFLWAFFLVMGLHPFVELVEDLMVFSYAFIAAYWKHRSVKIARDEAWDDADQPRDEVGRRLDNKYQYVRIMATLFVLSCVFISICLFSYFVYQNLVTVLERKEIYHKGFDRLGKNLALFAEKVHLPFVHPDQISKMSTAKLLDIDAMHKRAVEFVMGPGLHLLFSVALMGILIVFWLFGPMPLDPAVRSVFQRYIVIKSCISAGYATGVWILLAVLDVDMRMAFALLTFALNFVPEIGAFLSICLPLPIILFDGRLDNPIPKAVLVLIGEIVLKLIFSNILEVLVLESDMQMRMHPVVLLLCISFFGWAWGPTGMLLSVPIMAAFKALIATSAIPAKYRDPIVQMIEGDEEAMDRWRVHSRTSQASLSISPFKEARIASTSSPINLLKTSSPSTAKNSIVPRQHLP